MALTSPGLVLAIDSLFANIKPQLDLIRRLGATDFSADNPGIDIKPGTTIKVPLSGVSMALEFDDDTNNYLTGGDTTYGQLTAKHFLQGYDMRGTNIDAGVNAPRIKQLFSMRCSTGISMAAVDVIKSALNGTTTSTGVTMPASPTLAQYDNLAADTAWLDKMNSALVVNGAEWAKIKGVLHGAHLSATQQAAAEELGFRDLIVVPGMTPRACIVPVSSIGFIGRVPAIVANYKEAGAQTDPDSGLSIGIVVADDQKLNRIVVNGDLWFGACVKSANAAATEAGIIKVGTSV